jgi:type II secretory pathway pseudopilin PulG
VSRPRTRAFTLLEVIAVVLMLGLVFLVMGGVFSQIASTTTDANQTETTRRGLLLIDRVARDLEGTLLIEKPEETDPLEHPWLFLAESRLATGGADRLKFDSRSAQSRGEHAGGLAVVAYWAEPGDDDDLRLVRWSSPALPESLDRAFPPSSDEAAQVVANGLTRFAVRFTDDEGAAVSTWDSSTLERSGQLPVAAEVAIALRDETAPEGERTFTRRVVLPIRPIDLEKALSGDEDGDGDGDDEDEDEDGCVTVSECAAENSAQIESWLATTPDPDSIRAQINAAGERCAAEVLPSLGFPADLCE